MTLSTITAWTGGALGANPSTATEPAFTAQAGLAANAVYSPAIGGEAGQSVRVSAARDFTRAVSGAHWRVGLRVARVAGTQTAGQAILLFRSGTTNVGDIFLRNQNGGQYALRQGAGGTVYAGQSATAAVNGETPWRVEVEYESDGTTHTIRLYLFEPGNLTSTPDDSFTGTLATAVDNFRILNPTGATGLTMDFGEVLFEDTGAPIWAGGDTPGTLTFLSNVHASQTSAIIAGKVADAASVEFIAGGVSVTVAPDADGYFRAEVGGLTPGGSVPWEVLVDGVSRRTGTVSTYPTTADGLTFLWGSCFDTFTSGVFPLIAARNPAFIAMLGDWGYQYITGGPNGNTSPTDVATCRLHREPVLTSAAPQGLFTAFSTSYTVSDCDGGGANADGSTGGLATGAVQAAYRQQFAHPDLPLAASGARSWVIGRVRFVHTDETVAASPRADADTSAKTKLGAEQKAWFKGEIDAAVSAGQAVVWFGDGPWIESTSLTGNSWRAYNTERAELGAYIAASGVKLVRLHGDTHTLFADDGTNNPWGGFPTASAAPWHTTANPFTSPMPTNGTWPTATTNSSRQYGVGQVVDDGTNFTLAVHGYSSTNSAPAEVERFTMTVDLSTGVSVIRFIEWDGVTETTLSAFEWDGTTETPLTVEESV